MASRPFPADLCRRELPELLPASPEQIAAMFPKLDDGQIARLSAFGTGRDARAREVFLELGDLHHGIFIVLGGHIEIIRLSGGAETVLHVLGPGEFTGDEMIARVFSGGSEGLTQDDILDNITLTWLTNTALSGARLYWERLPVIALVRMSGDGGARRHRLPELSRFGRRQRRPHA